MNLYSKGIADEEALIPELEKLKKQRNEVKLKLAELRNDSRRAMEEAERYRAAMATLAEVRENIDNADFDAKRLVLDALNVRATIFPDGEIKLTGLAIFT